MCWPLCSLRAQFFCSRAGPGRRFRWWVLPPFSTATTRRRLILRSREPLTSVPEQTCSSCRSPIGAAAVARPPALSTPVLGVSVTTALVAINLSGSGVLGISGNISDENGLESLMLAGDSTGELILSGSNNRYGGGTVVEQGTLIVNNSGALLDGSSLTVGAGGTFIFDPTMGGTSMDASPSLLPEVVPEPGTLALFGVTGIVAAEKELRQSKTDNLPGSRGRLSRAWICHGSRSCSCSAVGLSHHLTSNFELCQNTTVFRPGRFRQFHQTVLPNNLGGRKPTSRRRCVLWLAADNASNGRNLLGRLRNPTSCGESRPPLAASTPRRHRSPSGPSYCLIASWIRGEISRRRP